VVSGIRFQGSLPLEDFETLEAMSSPDDYGAKNEAILWERTGSWMRRTALYR
jgi:hypothetical protein